MKSDLFQVVTNRMISLLEAGTIPWRKPWKGDPEIPRNLLSGRPYRGINLFLLHHAGFKSPFWLTFNQAVELGGKVKKGEKATHVYFWRFSKDGEAKKKPPLLRYYSVFNALQCEGITIPEPPGTKSVHPPETIGLLLKHLPQPPEILWADSSPVYDVKADSITVPRGDGSTPQLFQLLIHATGHPSRLKRKDVVDATHLETAGFSRENLVAEFGGAMLCGFAGIKACPVEDERAYIANWIAALKKDRHMAVNAASYAQKAFNFIVNSPGDAEEHHEEDLKEAACAR